MRAQTFPLPNPPNTGLPKMGIYYLVVFIENIKRTIYSLRNQIQGYSLQKLKVVSYCVTGTVQNTQQIRSVQYC
jgi:hypothetical protein